MQLTRYVARRLLLLIPVIIGITIVVFVLIHLIPGDPSVSLLGVSATNAQRAAFRHSLGLDQPLPVQYVKWFWKLLHLDFGTSISQQLPVRQVVVTAFDNTVLLAVGAGIIAFVVGSALGLIAAIRQNKVADRIAMGFAALATAIPGYWLGIFLIVVFSVNLQWLPSAGKTSPFATGSSPADVLTHMVLPVLAASATPAGIIARSVRASILEVANLDFVAGLRARGLAERAILIRHILANAFPTVLTVVGLQFGYLFSGIAFIEVVFGWPGIGNLLFVSISTRDLPVILGVVIFTSAVFVLINLGVDVARAVIDPQVRMGLISDEAVR